MRLIWGACGHDFLFHILFGRLDNSFYWTISLDLEFVRSPQNKCLLLLLVDILPMDECCLNDGINVVNLHLARQNRSLFDQVYLNRGLFLSNRHRLTCFAFLTLLLWFLTSKSLLFFEV